MDALDADGSGLEDALKRHYRFVLDDSVTWVLGWCAIVYNLGGRSTQRTGGHNEVVLAQSSSVVTGYGLDSDQRGLIRLRPALQPCRAPLAIRVPGSRGRLPLHLHQVTGLRTKGG